MSRSPIALHETPRPGHVNSVPRIAESAIVKSATKIRRKQIPKTPQRQHKRLQTGFTNSVVELARSSLRGQSLDKPYARLVAGALRIAFYDHTVKAGVTAESLEKNVVTLGSVFDAS